MRRNTDDRQISLLFGDDLAPAEAVEVERSFDPRLLHITEWSDEGYVTATDACTAIAYGTLTNFRQFVKRLNTSERWGHLLYRAIHVRTKHGARHAVDEPYLTEKQLVIICMRCDLPNMAEVRSHIADVFISYRHGKLRPADTETEVKLIDSADRAIDAAPGLMDVLRQLAANDNSILQKMDEGFDRLYRALVAKGREDFSQKDQDLYARVLDRYYGGLDPVIGTYKLTNGNGRLKPHPEVEVDHYNDRATDVRTENGWPLHPTTHRRKTAGEDFHTEFRMFQKRRKELQIEEEQRQPSLFDPVKE